MLLDDAAFSAVVKVLSQTPVSFEEQQISAASLLFHPRVHFAIPALVVGVAGVVSSVEKKFANN